MDKIFLIDKHTITYNDLIHYINGQLNIWDSQYTDLERFVLNTIKSLVSEPYIENHSHLIDVMEDTNGNIELKTSGTTGEPKIIYQSFEKMIRNIKLKNEDMVWGLFYSIDRMAGYQVLFQALLNKDTLVNMNGYDYKEIQQRILSYGVTHISATPTLYKMILDRVYPNVKQITFGGERSSKEFHHNISKYFPNARVKNIYASTEAGSLFASNGDTFTIPKKFMDKIRIKNDEIWLHKDIVGESFHMKWEVS
jgi:acyl-CoA synthetase (AMP-forming)/AMP-acid ligase II